MYQWDAVENYPHVLSVLDCFDEAYTFDERDSRLYRMEFLPLFYHPGYQAIGRRSKAKIEADYDVAFIGTAHPKKYGFVQEVVEQCEGLLDRKYIYHFLPSRLLYARHKLLSEDYRRAAYSQFHFDALTPEETEEVDSVHGACSTLRRTAKEALRCGRWSVWVREEKSSRLTRR